MLLAVRLYRWVASIVVASMLTGLPLSAASPEEPLAVGLSTRLSARSLVFSRAVYNHFAAATGTQIRFIEMPSQRVIRAFMDGQVDLLPFSLGHDASMTLTTRLPLVAPTLMLVGPIDAEPLDPVATLGDGEYAIPRGARSIYVQLGFKGNFVEVDQFDQALKLVTAGRVRGYFDWNSELEAQVGIAMLEG